MITRRVVYVAVCEGCGEPLGVSDDDPQTAFLSEAAAVAAIGGDPDLFVDNPDRPVLPAIRAADGTIICWTCATPELCTTRGHLFTDWYACHCTGNPPGAYDPRIEGHLPGCCPELRHCRRLGCPVDEERHLRTPAVARG